MAGTARVGSIHFDLGKLKHYLQMIHYTLSLSGREKRDVTSYLLLLQFLKILIFVKVIYHILKRDIDSWHRTLQRQLFLF